MYDIIIRGGTVIDGSGSAGVIADIAIADGRIAAIGTIAADAHTVVDAADLIVTPGFVDPHTHYDAQLFWDPAASPSNVHGVTSVIGGNCGFTIAPIRTRDADYMRRLLAKVEGMALPALETGVPWNWETFSEYLDQLDGNLGVNAGFLVGHCAIRRYVMGEESVGAVATAEQIQEMIALLGASIRAGGLGFSTTLSKTHTDGDGQPVPSRWANDEEVLALCAAVKDHEGTTLEAIVDGCLDMFSDAEIEMLAQMSAAGQRPLNWNVLTVDSTAPERIPRQLEASSRALEIGGRVVALTMPVQVPMNMSFGSYCALFMIPGWQDVMNLEHDERRKKLADPATRTELEALSKADSAGVFRRLGDWHNYVLGDVYAPANADLKGRKIGEIAAERGNGAFDTLLDIVIEDDLRTVLWPIPSDGDPKSWELRSKLWLDDRAMVGGSDAGAHLDRMCGAPYTTRFIGDCIRGRKLLGLETAIKMLTDDPARLFGLRDRGRIEVGWHADLCVLDPLTVGATHATLVADLPGGAARLIAHAEGVRHVFVNGVETVRDNLATGALPGTVLRSGRDTETVLP